MRRLLHVGLHAFQIERLHDAGLLDRLKNERLVDEGMAGAEEDHSRQAASE